MHHPRRRNGSNKIPNVILRPVAPLPSNIVQEEDEEDAVKRLGFDPSMYSITFWGRREFWVGLSCFDAFGPRFVDRIGGTKPGTEKVIDLSSGLRPFRNIVVCPSGGVDKVCTTRFNLPSDVNAP